jgi:hypothetical protein
MEEAIDLARQKKLPFRVNRGQVIDFSISANNGNGTPYDFTGHTAEMYVYNSFAKTDTPEFDIDVTLSIGTIAFSHGAITRKREDFVYQLWITDASGYRQPWLNGPFLVLNSEWNHEDSEDTITISPNGDDITLTITPLAGGESGSGDVTGPANSVDGNAVGFDGVTGKSIKDLGAAPVLVTRTINGQALSSNILIPCPNFIKRTGKLISNAITQEVYTPQALSANVIKAWPIDIGVATTLINLYIEVVTAVGSTSCRIALYADNGSNYPGAKITDHEAAGTIDTSSLGVKTKALTAGVISSPGRYWIVINSNGGPTMRSIQRYAMNGALGFATTLGSATPPLGWSSVLSYAAMPDNFPAGATLLNTICPAIGWEEA